ncbi:MAG: type II/IV secretion system protein [Armatimonadetes bacterium]|nr:type II/IV secretion system protein [Armatimonadota bacterium]
MISSSLRQNLGDVLLETGVVEAEDLQRALMEAQTTRQPLERVLERHGTDRGRIIRGLETYYRVPFVDLSQIPRHPELLLLLPESVIKQFQVLPLLRDGEQLRVAMACPHDVDVLDAISLMTGFKIQPLVATAEDLEKAISENFATGDSETIIGEIPLPPSDLPLSTGLPPSALVQFFLEEAVGQRASDIHLEPQEKGLLVRFRVDGMLRTVKVLPSDLSSAIVSRVKVLADLDIAEHRLPQDGSFRFSASGREIDVRLSVLPAKYGEKAVLRILDRTSFMMNPGQLGMSPSLQIQVEEICSSSSGVFLVVGPTGCGKTTTLYSLIGKLKSPHKNIITLEDPIEYELLAGSTREGGITQVQINPKIGLTFAEGLRASLRQDPEVILVGEIRDTETVEVVAQASLTGHLVLSTLHTNDAIQTILRLENMSVDSYLLSATLAGVLSQRLVRVLCPLCREPYGPPDGLARELNLPEGRTFFRNKGCRFCQFSGYRGRIAVFELLRIGEEIRDLISGRAGFEEISEAALRGGMQDLRGAAFELVLSGMTTVAEVFRVAPKHM